MYHKVLGREALSERFTLSRIVVQPNIRVELSGSNRGNIFRLPVSNIPKTSVLINQRCRLIIISSKCVSTHVVCECRPTLPSALAYTRTHTLSHSLSLRVSVLITFYIKTHRPQISSSLKYKIRLYSVVLISYR